jgi:hypothetical protein
MKRCPICNKFPVIKGSGMCVRHHRIFVSKVREFKVNFIEFMKIKEENHKKIIEYKHAK